MTRSLTLSFPARTEYLLLPRLALSGLARGTGMSEELLADLKLAVTEACGNAVRHAYGDGAGGAGVVRVSVEFDEDSVRIAIEDDGLGLSEARAWDDVPVAADGLVANEDEGGMGFSIIKAIADDLEIGPATGSERGTRVVLTKTLRD